MSNNKNILLFLTITICLAYAEVQLITRPEPGDEYVFLHTTGAGSRSIERKDKAVQSDSRAFETAHKVPSSITYAVKEDADPSDEQVLIKSDKSPKKREAAADPADPPAPAPAGAIKLDVQKLLEKYKTELKTSTTSTTSKPKSARARGGKASSTPTTEASPRGRRLGSGRRTKKEIQNEEVTASPVPLLTPLPETIKNLHKEPEESFRVDSVLGSASERQRSRIQIKKGPNGQEYEYEYVYYYYDDDDDDKNETVVNGHDGPAKEALERSTAKTTPKPSANEVVPTSRGRSRGRQLEEEVVEQERLPANTRFPPRGRNLNTTPASNLEEDSKKSQDSHLDETQTSRGRTRANVRRPNLDLVDNASFNTHTPSGNANGPSFPVDLPAGPVRFLGATPNDRGEGPSIIDSHGPTQEVQQHLTNDDTLPKDQKTFSMSPMDKVALDLYAILQGTQKLSGEDQVPDESTETSDSDLTTLESTTEIPTTEAPTTTTTTTTTTTPAPTTTEHTAIGKGSRFRGRPNIGRKPSATSSTSTEQPQETTKKNRFNRPSFGTRPKSRPTSAPAETEEAQKEEAKPVQATSSRTRSRFGASRNRFGSSTTEATAGNEGSVSSTSRASLRPRPSFNLRGRTKPSTQSPEAEGSSDTVHEEVSTTARSRLRVTSGNVRPLRPGPRINLGGRGRASTTIAPETPAESAPQVEEDQEGAKAEVVEHKEAEPVAAPDSSNPLTRLRNRQRQPLPVRPKPAASSPVPARRTNPLLARRKNPSSQSTEAPLTEAPQEVSPTEAVVAVSEEAEASTEPAPSSTTTTEEPKGLNKLLAGRRRLNLRTPGTIA